MKYVCFIRVCILFHSPKIITDFFQFQKYFFMITLLSNSEASIWSPTLINLLSQCRKKNKKKTTWHIKYSCSFLANVKFALPSPPLLVKFVLTEVTNMTASDMYTEHFNCDKTE